MSARIGRKIRVYGRVQGVFFRQWALGQARALGVAGWVRNCPDGSVEAHLVGDEVAVGRMTEEFQHGPSQARVEDVIVKNAEPEDLDSFSVRL